MRLGRSPNSSPLAVSLFGRLLADPQQHVVGAAEVSVLRLAVPRQADNFDPGTFFLDALTSGALTQEVKRRAEGCLVRVSGSLHVGVWPTPGGDHRWGIRLLVEAITLEEINLTGAPPTIAGSDGSWTAPTAVAHLLSWPVAAHENVGRVPRKGFVLRSVLSSRLFRVHTS